MTQQEFNEMLAAAIAGNLGGGTYISRWDGEQIDAAVDKLQLPGGIVTTDLADGAVTWPKLAVDAQPIRRNLLDNWDFVNPINQRSFLEGAFTGAGYFIDRWIACRTNIQLVDGGLSVAWNGINYGNGYLQQKFLPSQLPEPGSVLTVSLVIDNVLYSGWFTLPKEAKIVNYIVSIPNVMVSWEAFTDDDSHRLTIRFYSTEPKIVKAAKLELGQNQTLAHQDTTGNWVLNDPPPNKRLELFKCQAYQWMPVYPGNYFRARATDISTDYIEFYIHTPSSFVKKPTLVNADRIEVRPFINGPQVSGFTLAVGAYGPGWVSINAVKNNHGLTDAHLLFLHPTPNSYFDANL